MQKVRVYVLRVRIDDQYTSCLQKIGPLLFLQYLLFVLIDFYRATLCVSAVFAVVRVRLSVRLSVTLVDRIQTAKDIVKLLYLPGRPIILVFQSPAPIPSFKENPLSRDAKYKRWENFAIFD